MKKMYNKINTGWKTYKGFSNQGIDCLGVGINVSLFIVSPLTDVFKKAPIHLFCYKFVINIRLYCRMFIFCNKNVIFS